MLTDEVRKIATNKEETYTSIFLYFRIHRIHDHHL